MKVRPSEIDVAKGIIGYLTGLQWEVFQEVSISSGGPRADIVARQNSIVWIIETKTTFGLPVIEQARRWEIYSHLVSVATPSHVGEFGKEVCRLFGVGILSAGRTYSDGSGTTEVLRPRLNRRPLRLPKLCEEHKTYAPAGTNGGGYFTPYNRTCRDVLSAVTREPGITMKKLVDIVDHHYASDTTARNCLRNWIKWDKVPGVEIRYEGNKMFVHPKEATP